MLVVSRTLVIENKRINIASHKVFNSPTMIIIVISYYLGTIHTKRL